jgi:ubiquinone/menaquinone biosynthesis C-methylase UbiE
VRVTDWRTRCFFVAADGQMLPFKSGIFDAVICQLGLQFFSDPARGLRSSIEC